MTEKSLKTKSDELNLSEYDDFLENSKPKFKRHRFVQFLKSTANSFYSIGKSGVKFYTAKNKTAGGSKVIQRLAKDLKKEFPEMKGFSTRNLK